ncbi:MAG: hypothetical protein ACU826_01230 [Gammaproteobacteria bacterium]
MKTRRIALLMTLIMAAAPVAASYSHCLNFSVPMTPGKSHAAGVMPTADLSGLPSQEHDRTSYPRKSPHVGMHCQNAGACAWHVCGDAGQAAIFAPEKMPGDRVFLSHALNFKQGVIHIPETRPPIPAL